MSFFESAFQFLFKYRPVVFQEGEFAFAASPLAIWAAIALVVVALGVLVHYSRFWSRENRVRDALVLGGLRFAGLALLLFLLLQPSLVLSVVVPQQTFVGVLLDESKSMLLRDRGDEARAAFVQEELDPVEGRLLSELAERFKVRLFSFSKGVRRIADVGELTYAGGETRLGPALEQAADELATVPLAGLVMISDGADNTQSTLADTLLDLRARQVPVFTVGVGEERFAKDIQLSRVEAPRSVLEGSSVMVEVTLDQVGFGGSRVRLDVEDSGRIVNTQEVRFPVGGESATVRVHFTATRPGPRRFRFRVPPESGEFVVENNEYEVLIVVEDRREKILYFEGEPRYEVGFIRRAVAGDENLQLVVLQRTAENKFYRLDLDDEDELAGGFPTTREELFGYRGLILGSVEAGFLTYAQMRMVADFVGQRGGGFMMIGGRRSFSEGGYAGTPIGDVLPVALEAGVERSDSEPFHSEVKVELTPHGRTHPATQLAPDEETSAQRWASLPPLNTRNPVTRLKPGATSLLEGKGKGIPGTQIVLAHQRYGRGRSLALTAHDTWMWQMHADIPLEDQTHETLWRQLLRWLVSYVPDQVMVTTERDRFAPGERVTLTAEVRDEGYLAVNNADVLAVVKAPDGTVQEHPMEWTVDRDGEYRATFPAQQLGLYEVSVRARQEDRELGTATTHIEAAELRREYFNAEMRASLLQRIAEETGGEFYDTRRVRQLPEDLSYTDSGSTVLEHRDLWDMPIAFLLLVGCLAGEWAYRKARGLA